MSVSFFPPPLLYNLFKNCKSVSTILAVYAADQLMNYHK